MRRWNIFVGLIGLVCLLGQGCGGATARLEMPGSSPVPDDCIATESAEQHDPVVSEEELKSLVAELVASHGPEHKTRIQTGLHQVAQLWRAEDGSAAAFSDFCRTFFFSDSKKLDAFLARFEENLEQILGHLHEIALFLRQPTDLDVGPLEPVDHLFAQYNLGSHVTDDFFKTKIAFAVLLNFKIYSLTEKLAARKKWSRNQWARARAADLFTSRVPAQYRQAISASYVTARAYIASYNIHLHHLLGPTGDRLFPKGLKLITHWGLRDEIKAQYADPEGLERQRMIQLVMERIIDQQIPAAVVDNPHLDWTVATNRVQPSAVVDFDPAGYRLQKSRPVNNEPENTVRYEHLLRSFKAVKAADRFYPTWSNFIARKFEQHREIPQEELKRLFEAVLTAPVMVEVAGLIKKRLGRPLEPFDIWYNGFAPRGKHSPEKLDAAVKAKYPSVEAFQNDLPHILAKLGFDAKTAAFLSANIVVDPSRGAGHASGAEFRAGKTHLRTRIPQSGMQFKGYNIAIHEFGHNVEQVFSLHRVDRYLLNGVPNTAFTESFAFAFQENDIALLGLDSADPLKDHFATLETIWSTFEIAGVGMLDMAIWQWMYDHPEATPADLKAAVLTLAKEVWNRYFAPVLGVKDQTLLAIYSHIIYSAMYTPDYGLGYLIQFQLQDYFKRNGLAKEMERMCRQGRITPDAWMHEAVGGPISAKPMIEAGQAAVAALKN